MVRFPPKRRARLGLNMAPLLDVVFLLLLFFMLTSTFSNPAIALNLPKGKSGSSAQKKPVVVSADLDGTLYVNQKPVDLDSLEDAVRLALSKMEKKDVHFRGDKKISYDLFVSVMDRARSAGAISVHIELSGSQGAK